MKVHKHIIIVFLLSLCYATLTACTGLNTYDEGILLTGGFRVLHGDIPHSNFSSLYPAGSYYFIAPFIAFFKNSLLISRLLASLIFAFNCVYIFLFTKRISSSPLAPFTAWTIVTLWCGLPSTTLRAVFIALFFALTSLYIITTESIPNKRRIFLSIAFLLLCSLFRWDIALYCAAALSGFYSLKKSRNRYIGFITTLLAISIISITVPLLFVFLLGGKEALYSAWQQSILFPIIDFPHYRQLPIPFFFPRWSGESRGDVILSTITFWGISLIFVHILYTYVRKRTLQSYTHNTLLFSTLIIFTLCSLNQARVRTDFEHHIPALFTGAILFAVLLTKRNEQLSLRSFHPLSRAILFILIAIPVSLKVKQLTEVRNYSAFQTATLQGISYKNSTTYDQLISFITQKTNPNEKILICPSENNLGTSCDILLYYAAQRLPATQWHEFHPGITSRHDIQLRIINDLKKNNCRLLIRQSVQPSTEPNHSSFAQSSSVLDTYIRQHYHSIEVMDSYTILARNTASFSH